MATGNRGIALRPLNALFSVGVIERCRRIRGDSLRHRKRRNGRARTGSAERRVERLQPAGSGGIIGVRETKRRRVEPRSQAR
jgi:hypothetical protein